MDNIIKLPAQQALFDKTNRLVDLILPGNSGVYDLSETYIAITCSQNGIVTDLTAADQLPGTAAAPGNPLPLTSAVQDVRVALQHNPTTETIYDNCAVPVEALVRNCSMFSANKGKVEDLRRSDILRATMKAYTNDVEDVEDNSIGGLAPMAKANPWASGRLVQMVGVGDTSSRTQTHEIRIFLKDIFNFGAVEAYDSSSYGSLSIHLELNLNRLKLLDVLGVAATWDRYYHNQGGGADQAYPALSTYSQAVDQQFINSGTAGAATYPVSQSTITMAAQYCSLEDSPYFVNQVVNIATTYSGNNAQTGLLHPVIADSGDDKWAVIKDIAWDKTTKQITLGFGAEVLRIHSNGTAVLKVERSIHGVPSSTASLGDGLTIESVEMTAVRRPDMDSGPSQNQYTQFLTQSDQFSNQTTLHRSYYLPPQTTNAYIVMPSSDIGVVGATPPSNFSDILGCARLEHYRFSINNEPVTNREIPFMPVPNILGAAKNAKCDHGSSLHYQLISETMMNAGTRFNSLNEAVFDQLIPYSTDVPEAGGVFGFETIAACPTKACYMLALPIPISNDQTQLTIELQGIFANVGGEMHIFSEVRSVI